MRFADRLDRIPLFFFIELRLKAERKRATGVDVIALGAADPDVPTPDAVVEAMRRAVADPVHHRYPHTRGIAAFREAACAFMAQRFGVALDPDTEIVPALGGKDAVHHMAMTCLGPGDICLSPEPGYPVYTSAPLEQPLEVTGPLTVCLHAASTAPDTDFVARLCDVFPDGSSRVLAEGIVRARFRQGCDQPRPIEPGKTVEYRIDLVATSNLFLPGHRIRVDVTSSSFPRFDPNPNTGRPLGTDGPADLRPALQTIFHDHQWPSHIVLPIIPR